ncbi:Molybdate-binding periplasmic protein [bacterium HR18]|nr:Molybdate-binding periplasmic protein [bacterium HR18]
MRLRQYLRGLLVVLAGGLWVSACQKPPVSDPRPRKLHVAAAADLRYAFEVMRVQFEAVHPGVQLKLSYGSSGQFFAQIRNGAPFDLYFSADVDYPQRLIAEGLAVDTSFFLYAVGQLVVWVPNDSPLKLERWEELAGPNVRRLAIANPQHAPYGRAAIAALQALGLYERVRDRFVFGENVAQTAQFVASGAAEAGIIALSLALAPEMQARGRYRLLPHEHYPPIAQGAVILLPAAQRPEAWAFWRFVQTVEGRQVLASFGFLSPDAVGLWTGWPQG